MYSYLRDAERVAQVKTSVHVRKRERGKVLVLAECAKHACIRARTRTHMYTHARTQTRTHTHTHTHTHTQGKTHAQTDTRTHTCTHTHTRRHTHTHTHTHTTFTHIKQLINSPSLILIVLPAGSIYGTLKTGLHALNNELDCTGISYDHQVTRWQAWQLDCTSISCGGHQASSDTIASMEAGLHKYIIRWPSSDMMASNAHTVQTVQKNTLVLVPTQAKQVFKTVNSTCVNTVYLR